MKKTTYTATAPDGTVVTRTTHRTYTHVIVGRPCRETDESAYKRDEKLDPAWYAECMARVQAKADAGYYNTFMAIRWCGRLDLAQRESRAQYGFVDLVCLPAVEGR